MSRSRRKTKIFGVSKARSEKWDKVFYHRRLRHRVAVSLRESLREGEEPEVLAHFREVSDLWAFAKDGKIYWGQAPEKEMRKRKVRLNEKESVSTFIVCIHSDQHDRMRQQR